MKDKYKELLKNGLLAGILSCIISAALNFFVFPFPDTIMKNALNHGIGGFFSGFISAVVGIMFYIQQSCRASRNQLKHQDDGR